MSHIITSLGALLAFLSACWFLLRGARIPPEKRRQSLELSVANAMMLLGVASLSTSDITTEVTIDRWSTWDWVRGTVFVLLVFCTGITVERAFALWRQRKSNG